MSHSYQLVTWRDLSGNELAQALAPVINAVPTVNVTLDDENGNPLQDEYGNVLETQT